MNSRMISDVIQGKAKTTYFRHTEESDNAGRQVCSVDGEDPIEDLGRRPIALQDEGPNLR
jgi:hypothetical protein